MSKNYITVPDPSFDKKIEKNNKIIVNLNLPYSDKNISGYI
jgi:hypothetical protein